MQTGTQTSVDRNGFVWACGRKVLTEDRDFARECGEIGGIYGKTPTGDATRGATGGGD